METVRYRWVEPYTTQFGDTRPYIPVRLQHGGRAFDTMGLIDSGADGSLFNLQWAQVLGFTLDPSRVQQTGGVGGTADLWTFDMHITVAGKRFAARVGFSNGCPKEFGLLGRSDFFRAFAVGIDEPGNRVLLRSNS